ncbi:MAG: ATP-binding protein, partial [Clostridia bacterium]|nr:ATP-binding protein [Clostridia bacterium]
RDFIDGLPYSHMLLYGDRGTGKSSTIHAMLNRYCDNGLRLIEVEKDNLKDIKKIKQQVADLPLKFIIFIDDLALSEQDEKNSLLKSAIEGSLLNGKNVMIVATSNRRHVIKESFSDRENSVHPADSIEEQLSLSDRFGLTVMFSSTDKASYLSIVRQLAKDYRLTTSDKSLEALAERWAIINGGRSPRRAKQFIDYVYACEQSKREIDF